MERKFKSLITHLLKVSALTGVKEFILSLEENDYYQTKRMLDHILKFDESHMYKIDNHEYLDQMYLSYRGLHIVFFKKS